MSEKIPITLHNSDLFLNSEFIDISKKKLNLHDFKSFLSKKRSSLADKDKKKLLYTSDLLPSLQIPTHLNKTVSSYIDSPTFAFLEARKRNLESGSGGERYKTESEKLNDKIAEARDTFRCKSLNGASRCKSLTCTVQRLAPTCTVPLKYKLRSGLTPGNEAQVEFHKNSYLSGLTKTKFWYSRQSDVKQTRGNKNNKQNEIVLSLNSTKNNTVPLERSSALQFALPFALPPRSSIWEPSTSLYQNLTKTPFLLQVDGSQIEDLGGNATHQLLTKTSFGNSGKVTGTPSFWQHFELITTKPEESSNNKIYSQFWSTYLKTFFEKVNINALIEWRYKLPFFAVPDLRSGKRCPNEVLAQQSFGTTPSGQSLPSLIYSGISREFLLVSINLILFSILAVVQRSNYGKGSSPTISIEQSLCKNRVFTTGKELLTKTSFGNSGKTNGITSFTCQNLTKTPFLLQVDGSQIEDLVCNAKHQPVINNCSERGSHTMLYASKIPNVSTSFKIAENGKQSSWQYLNQIKPGHLSFVLQHKTFTVPWQDQKQEQFIGVFLKKPDINSCITSNVKRNSKCKQVGPVKTEQDLLQNNVLSTNRLPQLTNVIEDVIQPWYCIKACNISDNKIVATRSVKKTVNNSPVYNNHKIQGFQYYLPYYTSQERIFAENDTIPSKRGSPSSQKMSVLQKPIDRLAVPDPRSSIHQLVTKTEFLLSFCITPFLQSGNKVLPCSDCQSLPKKSFGTTVGAKFQSPEQSSGQLSSSITLSQSVLKRLFYKYGFLIISVHKVSDEPKIMPKVGYVKTQGVTKTSFGKKLLHAHTFYFVPDNLVRNSSVSGYQFPELKKKEIVYLFRKKVLFYSYLNVNAPDNKLLFDGSTSRFAKTKFLQKLCFGNVSQSINRLQKFALFKQLLTQLTTPFRTFKSYDLISQVLLIDEGLPKQSVGLALNKSPITNSRSVISDQDSILGISGQGLDTIDLTKQRMAKPYNKMQYTQVNLDEIENAKDLFKKMGRDYEDYLRQPKDSLPALIISPSLEDDREIEEEGIQIFRKRDFIKNKNVKSATNRNGEVGQGDPFINKASSEDLSISKDKDGEPNIDNIFFLSTATPEFSEKRNKSERTESKSEMQNHQFLVRNALRQAQEEIDSIAKKEEKGSEKDKQVIPPLTRLEALYTIRNRERKREQAKSFTLGKGTASSLRSHGGTKPFNFNVRSLISHFNLGKKKAKLCDAIFEKNGVVKNTPLPFFEELFLYSDQANNTALKNKFKFGLSDNWILTPWLFSKLGDAETVISNQGNRLQKQSTIFTTQTPLQQSICTDRKHSFFGEMSLPARILTAQEQKQIFQQKANPLLKVNKKLKVNTNSKSEEKQTRVTILSKDGVLAKTSFLQPADTQIRVPSVSTSKVSKFDQYNNFDSVATTLPFSLLSPLSISSKTNIEKSVGEESRHIVPKVFTQSPRFQIGTRLLPESTSFNQGNSHYVPVALVKGSPPPIYSYENISQNRACQGSAPKIKGTPLGSPVSHRVWQPKRMEPSTFRVSPRDQSTPVVLRITQKDWKNMMKWQLKKHFFEEDKRLLPLSSNNNKSLKIKTINLYLPWLSIKQDAGIINNQAWVDFSNKLVADERLSLNKTDFYNRDAVFSNEWPLTRLDLRESSFDVTSLKSSNKKTQLDGKSTNYWRFPTQKSLLTINGPVKKEQSPELHKNLTKTRNKKRVFVKFLLQLFVTTFGKAKHQLYQNKGLVSPNSSAPSQSTVQIPKQRLGVGKKVFNELILFESVTRYSWLFIYTFIFVLMFKQLFQFVYQVGLKDVFIKFLNSDFGRTITSEEFRYSIQNLPLTEFYMPKTRLKELLGLEKKKVQLLEIVWFLRNNCQGRNGPRGILLVGPPGVENVSVVQAIAGEAEVPIIVQSLEKIAQDNEPQRQLEQLYMRAQKQAPCVLFLDQLDTIGARRDQLFTDKRHTHNWGSSTTSVFGQEKYNVNFDQGVTKQSFGNREGASLQQLRSSSYAPSNKLNVVLRLLTILDGITQSSGVVTVATAQDITKLDPALLRPKRFDRRIYLSLPNRQDRVHLLKLQTQSIGHIKEMPWDYLSLQTEHMSTADIKSAINYSLFRAVLKKSVHTVETLEYGIDCVKTLTDKRVKNI